MKKELLIINKHIEIQLSLVKFMLAKEMELDQIFCDTIYLDRNDVSTKEIIYDIFHSLTENKLTNCICYTVSNPKEQFLLALQDCINQQFLNKWISYFCLRKPHNRKEFDGATPVLLCRQTETKWENKDIEWEELVRYLQGNINRVGQANFFLPGFTFIELKEDFYIKSLIAEFNETRWFLQDVTDKQIIILEFS